ncbi:flagellar hook-basal body complex protein [Azospirillum lipoferum]|uniref:Flagellar hook protein FlgE n=1 Tax=Azospirillum lipoferum (strain 4B) TaxID=862719 RepID=G7ZAL2_AZOL4|nr:flagellar hook-basal body complex protein [Azospirillum lipoferum]CBS88836.1 putative flagellar hook protein FlgE-like [Azospirillum lipoferum 4B]
MSIFGSMTTAVLGLNAQSKALGHISDNIANSSTIGYKRVDSAFETMVLQSSQRLHEPGGVTAQPVFMNNIQGSLKQVQSPTNVAIQGQGFFSVSKINLQNSTNTLVQTQTGAVNASSVYYTRAGDFELDKSRYLVNSSGYALNGWLVDPVTGVLKKDQVAPVQVSSLIDKPVATSTIDLEANLPATPTPGKPIPDSSIPIFDSQGNPRTINFKWRQQADSSWRMVLDAPGSNTKPVDGTFSGNPATVTFGQNIAGQTAVAQVNVVTISGNNTNGQDNLRIGDVYTVKVNGTNYSLKITADNIGSIRTYSGLAGALANQINSASPAASVLATSSGQTIRVTAREAGTPFKLNTEVSSGTNTTNTIVAQTSTAATASAGEIDKFQFPQTQVEIGDSFTITVNGTPISYTVTAATYQSYSTVSDVVSQLAGKINQQLGTTVTASSAGNILSIQSNTANTNVTSSAAVTNSASAVNTLSSLPSVASVAGVRQSRTVTLTGTPGDIGTQYTLSINGTAVTYSTTGEEMTMEDITAALANKINANTSLPVTATAQGGVITVTAKTAASPTGTNTLTNDGAGNITFGGSTVDIGDTYSMTVNGQPYSLTITNANYGLYDTPAKLLNYFATEIVADGGTATVNGTGTVLATGDAAATVSVTDAAPAQFTLEQSAVAGQTPAHIGLTFGKTPETVGTLTNISTALVGTGTAVSAANQSAGSDANVTFTVDYGFGPQQISLNLGKYQKPGGLTQYAGEEINVSRLIQNGAPRGQFKDVVFGDNGAVMVNYDNGRSKMIARVPIITFNNPNALQRESGGVFLESEDAGKPNFNDPETNGAGAVVANSVESSNVDIADEFTKMIVTQRSYSANAKIVTTSDEMLQEVLGLKR